MKKSISIMILTALMPVALSAQSSDAAYPESYWINEVQGTTERPYDVYISVSRVTEKNPDRDGKVNCGYITVTDNKTDKVVYDGDLSYFGKGLKSGVGNGVYYFNVTLADGRVDRLGIRKDQKLNLEIVSLTGPMGSHPFTKEELYQGPLNGSWTPACAEVTTEKELLKALREAQDDYDKERIAHRTRGFGDVQLYIKAHTGLNPNLPKSAKLKGSATITIREKADASSVKLGEMAPAQSLMVVDEYNGWCQVKMGTGKYGWVPLSAVTLSNSGSSADSQASAQTPTLKPAKSTAAAKPATQAPTAKPAAQTATAQPAASSFVLGNGKLGPLSINQTVASLPKSVAGLYDRYQVKTEERGDEDGTWTETWVHFYKGGQVIFKAFVDDNKKLVSFALEQGSSFIKTTEGYYVGYNARELFNKKRMQWQNWYIGTAFARSGHFEFHIPDDGLTTDIPQKVSDVKPSAKISEIVYYKDLPE